jgi:hypothetical protein
MRLLPERFGKLGGGRVQWACHFDIARRKALKAVVSGMIATECVLFVRQVRAFVTDFAAIAGGPLIERDRS